MENGAQRRVEYLRFYGTAGEYFGIWIVNILLTIVTLGIYSAWAKVRRQRYFYGNTFLDGQSFEYHARPVQILVGRVIALVLLVVYNILVNLNPIVGGVAFLALIFGFPYLIARGIRFNARVSSYRNVRFDFTGGYGGALVAFIIGPMITVVTFGIFAPQASRWHYRYLFNNMRYGGRKFAASPRLGALYGAWVLPAVVAVLSLVVIGWLASIAARLNGAIDLDDDQAKLQIVLLIYLFMITVFLAYTLAGLLYNAGVRNVVFRSTVFDGKHRLHSELGRARYTFIAVSNFIMTIFSFGLLRPWAAVRMAQYVWSHTALEVQGDLGTYMSELKDEKGVVGAEFMDIEGIDIGF